MVPPRSIADILRERVRREPTDATATRAAADLERIQRQAARAGAGTMGVPSGLVEEPLGQQVSRIGTEMVLPVSLPELFGAGKKAARGDTKGAVKQAGMEGALSLLTAGVASKVKAGRAAAKLGLEALEESRLIGRPMNFPEEKSALAQRLRAEAETPLPPAMRDKPIVEMSHSSPYLFDRPKIDRRVAGTGAGDYWQAPGLYGTTSRGPESVENVYRIGTSYVPSIVQMPSGIVLDRDMIYAAGRKFPQEDLNNFAANKAITNLLTASETYYDSPKELRSQIKKLRASAQKTFQKLQTAKPDEKSDLREQFLDYMDMLSEARGNLDISGKRARLPQRIPQDLRQATYNVQFAAAPDELFDLERSAADQPASERILAALRGMSNPASPSESLADALVKMERRGMSPYRANEMLVGNKYRGGADMFPGLDRFELMNELNARGIVGNRYLTKFAKEDPNLPRTFNYVAQDPSRVRLTDVWAAAPIGLALNAADRQQRKQEPQAKR